MTSRVMAAATDEAILLRVVHDIPGRLRLRLSPDVGAENVADAAARIDGVVESRWSPLTRGLLVRYRPEAVNPDAIVAEVARHVASGEPPETVSAVPSPRPATLGDAVKVTFAAIDDRLRTASYGQVGLSGLASLGLARPLVSILLSHGATVGAAVVTAAGAGRHDDPPQAPRTRRR